MNKFLLRVWEDVEEIIIHLTGSTIIILAACISFYLIKLFASLLFSEGHIVIEYLENASQITIFVLYLISVLKTLTKKIRE